MSNRAKELKELENDINSFIRWAELTYETKVLDAYKRFQACLKSLKHKETSE
jgi:hypothetical protein